ncbi:MAG: hypothetical protein V5789_14050 [Colwellia sp.]
MDITKLSFTPRKRTPWEVFDLTQLMVLTNFVPLMKIVILLYTPLGLILWGIFSAETASLMIWWLKPLLERPLLDFLSKRSFSQPTSAWSCIKSIRYLSKTDIFTMLTIHRFSPNRAYFSSIEQLEKLKGNVKKSRKSVLFHHGKHKQTFWMLFCVHVEFLFTLLLIAVVFNFIPQGVTLDDQFIMSSLINGSFEQIYFCSYLIAIQLIAPYFVTGGFLAYLNTRVNLEAWDIELAFKQIANKIGKTVLTATVMIFSYCVDIPAVTATDFQPDYRQTQESNNKLSTVEATRLQVTKIYQDNELIEKSLRWQAVTKEPEEPQNNLNLNWLDNLIKVIASLESFIGYISWFLVIALIVWGAIKLYIMKTEGRLNFGVEPIKKTVQESKTSSFFTNITSPNWPDDLLFAAEQASIENKFREALTYILRFSLLLAEQHSPVTIHPSMTERECEKALMNALPNNCHTQYRQLFSVWIQQAWAHKKASKHQIDELILAFRAIEAVGINNE